MKQRENVIKVKLPESTEKALAAFMAREMISTMDKNVVIARALEVYLSDYAREDEELAVLIEKRSVDRSKRGREAWEKKA